VAGAETIVCAGFATATDAGALDPAALALDAAVVTFVVGAVGTTAVAARA
jgi:hypothetical protein